MSKARMIRAALRKAFGSRQTGMLPKTASEKWATQLRIQDATAHMNPSSAKSKSAERAVDRLREGAHQQWGAPPIGKRRALRTNNAARAMRENAASMTAEEKQATANRMTMQAASGLPDSMRIRPRTNNAAPVSAVRKAGGIEEELAGLSDAKLTTRANALGIQWFDHLTRDDIIKRIVKKSAG